MSVWMIWPTLSSRLIFESSLSMRASVAASTRPWLCACGHFAGCTLVSAAMPAAAESRIAASARAGPFLATEIMLPSMCDLVDADVVDFHALREGCVVDPLLSAPGPPDRDIEDQVLGRVERPRVVSAIHFTIEP